MTEPKTDAPGADGWADRPEIKRKIRIVLYAVCAILVLAEFVVHRHTVHDLETIPAFYTLYGFASLILAVAVARLLRLLVRRDENYYGNRDAD